MDINVVLFLFFQKQTKRPYASFQRLCFIYMYVCISFVNKISDICLKQNYLIYENEYVQTHLFSVRRK